MRDCFRSWWSRSTAVLRRGMEMGCLFSGCSLHLSPSQGNSAGCKSWILLSPPHHPAPVSSSELRAPAKNSKPSAPAGTGKTLQHPGGQFSRTNKMQMAGSSERFASVKDELGSQDVKRLQPCLPHAFPELQDCIQTHLPAALVFQVMFPTCGSKNKTFVKLTTDLDRVQDTQVRLRKL